jgi:hypothetical protein
MADEAQMEGLRRLVERLDVFSAHCLKIADKAGRTVPFLWNKPQKYLHDRLEAQLKATGKVRALVLKGRQQGISTYVAARFYHKTTTNFGRKTLIVAHQQKSTNGLFDMVKLYHKNNPMPVSTANSNAIELVFDKLGSKYSLATAGTEDVARGMTAQLGHLSEFAFWSNGQKHLAGLGNAIPDVDGSEVIIESTANGLGNAFHSLWQEAEAGRGEYIAVFIPWFWSTEYRAALNAEGFQRSDEEQTLAETYGLDDEQLQWRRNKISSYGDGFQWLFLQEYPNCAAEAFQTSTQNPLINPTNVMSAVNSMYRDNDAPLLIGCDPAGDGVNDADRTAIAFRRGRMVFRLEYHQGLNTMQIAGKLAEYAKEMGPDAIFVDKGGLGAGVHDRLVELNIPVIGVNSATAATDYERYENKRAEMWWTMKEWFDDQPCRIPNNPALISDLTAPQPKVSSNGRKLLEKKDDMKKRQVRSPDGGDAVALTFAEPVAHRTVTLYGHRKVGKAAPTSAGY